MVEPLCLREFCGSKIGLYWHLQPAPGQHLQAIVKLISLLRKALQWHHIALEVREKGKGFVKGTVQKKEGFAD